MDLQRVCKQQVAWSYPYNAELLPPTLMWKVKFVWLSLCRWFSLSSLRGVAKTFAMQVSNISHPTCEVSQAKDINL